MLKKGGVGKKIPPPSENIKCKKVKTTETKWKNGPVNGPEKAGAATVEMAEKQCKEMFDRKKSFDYRVGLFQSSTIGGRFILLRL